MTPGAASGERWPRYSRADFRGVFVRKYPVLARALFDPGLKRPDLTDPLTIERAAAPFAGAYGKRASPAAARVPRTIWMLWQQGWDAAPPLVRRCAETWAEHNPGWRLKLLDDASVGEYAAVDVVLPRSARRPRADLARIALLAEHGGVWADATLFCTRPLDDWLPPVLDSGFFMFADPRPYRSTDNWFIVSEPGGHMIGAMRSMFAQYWHQFRHPHHYLWMHYLIEYLVERDPVAADTWAKTPKLPALGPLVVFVNAFRRAAPAIVGELIDANALPVHKLNHKWRRRGSLSGTPLARLTGLEHL